MFLDVESTCECDVAVEMPLVEFVEDERLNSGEVRILYHLPQQDPFGFEFDSCCRTGRVLESDLITNLVPQFHALLTRDAGCEQSRRKPSWLQNHDLSAPEQSMLEQHLWNLCGLS